MADVVYYGCVKCSSTTGKGDPCRNKAYWLSSNQYLCGVHSKSDHSRQALPKNPNKKKDKALQLLERQKLVEEAAKKNKNEGFIGDVICVKMGMMKEVEHNDGYFKVFPNYKHQNRSDGYGCMSLSPKAMGPINHKQEGLPPAKNLENMWQGSKCFPREVGADGFPSQEFYDTRLSMYNDPIPHRHKIFIDGSIAKGNIPMYSVWVDKEGYENFLKYVESRQIYCNFYEEMAKKSQDFANLKYWKKQGYNLQICGYDGYHVTKSIDEHYKDTSRPFGHEMVLYTLLTVDNEKDYPWRKFQTLKF